MWILQKLFDIVVKTIDRCEILIYYVIKKNNCKVNRNKLIKLPLKKLMLYLILFDTSMI